MKATLKLIVLLTYTIAVFFIENYIVLSIIALLNIALMLLLKVPKLKALKNIYFLSFFILFTAVINLRAVQEEPVQRFRLTRGNSRARLQIGDGDAAVLIGVIVAVVRADHRTGAVSHQELHTLHGLVLKRINA